MVYPSVARFEVHVHLVILQCQIIIAPDYDL